MNLFRSGTTIPRNIWLFLMGISASWSATRALQEDLSLYGLFSASQIIWEDFYSFIIFSASQTIWEDFLFFYNELIFNLIFFTIFSFFFEQFIFSKFGTLLYLLFSCCFSWIYSFFSSSSYLPIPFYDALEAWLSYVLLELITSFISLI